MGRNKIKIEKISNERIRQVTFYKRKRGLLKKAMELSLLCDVKVMLCIVDKNEKVLIFSSETDVRNFAQRYMTHPENARELYNHPDYKEIFENDAKLSEYSELKNSRYNTENEYDSDILSEEESKFSKKKNNNINNNEGNKKSKFYSEKKGEHKSKIL
jgi:hypothetical protein